MHRRILPVLLLLCSCAGEVQPALSSFRLEAPNPAPAPQPLPPDQPSPPARREIRLLLAYTQAARKGAGGQQEDMVALLELAVSFANEAYRNSGSDIQLQIAHMMEVNDVETANVQTDLLRLQDPADRWFDEVHEQRKWVQADLVSLIGYFDACGKAYLLQDVQDLSFSNRAFSVVSWDCAADHLSLAHEIGHNQGMNHNPESASGPGAFAYSYGHLFLVNDQMYQTVMAIGPGIRIPYFSSPHILYQGVPTGTPDRHNALTLENTFPLISTLHSSE